MNPNISVAYWWLTAVTLPFWVCALYWNWRAVTHGVIEGVKIRAATTVLAAIYLAATVVLLFTDINPQQWSDVLRGLQLLTVPIVWTQPAKWSVRVADRIRETDRKVIDRYDGDL